MVEKEELRFSKKDLMHHWLEDGGSHVVEIQEVCRTENSLQQTVREETRLQSYSLKELRFANNKNEPGSRIFSCASR